MRMNATAVHVPALAASAVESHGAWRGKTECQHEARIEAAGSGQRRRDAWCLS
jgi:hypothetical protein